MASRSFARLKKNNQISGIDSSLRSRPFTPPIQTPIQTKLTVGESNDQYEQEADQVADQVVGSLQRMETPQEEVQMKPLANNMLQKQEGSEEEDEEVMMKPDLQRETMAEEEEEVMMKSEGSDPAEVDDEVASTINKAKGSGSALPDIFRSKVEQAIGADFSGVRVHTDQTSDTLSRSLSARAFTTGNDIFFKQGEYNPASSEGQKLITHELTHTLQQGASSHNPQRKIQRKMGFKSSDLEGSLTFKAKVAGIFGKTSTFAKIQSLLAEYEKESNPFKQQTILNSLQELGNKWMKDHGSSKDAGDIIKANSIRQMLTEIEQELKKPIDLQAEISKPPTPEEQEKYMQNILGGKYKYITKSGQSAGADFEGTDQEAAKYGMSDAELAGIRIYTAQDYKYMNPVLAQSEGWLDAKTSELTEKKEWNIKDKTLNSAQKGELKAEAFDHSRMAVSGLAKLPDWKGDGFRGLALPLDDVQKQYADGKSVVFAPFTSTSTNKSVSSHFAQDEAHKSKGAKVGVLLILKITKGKDVNKISANPGEQEVLLPPGSSFTVSGDPKLNSGTGLYEVIMNQTA